MLVTKKKFIELAEKVEAIEKQVSTSEDLTVLDEKEKLMITYALNVCTVSISQIIDYNDLYILEQEYDAILNNINLRNFKKHDALLKVIKQILDTVNFFRIQEGEMRFIDKKYRQDMKNAIWKAAQNSISVIISSKSPITMLTTAVTQVATGYMNYRNAKNEALDNKEKSEWELQKAAITQFHCLRRDLFEAAWRLSEEYDFPDEYRLTEKQINLYCETIKDVNLLRRYEKLEAISDKFEAYPLFWYYKGHTAMLIYRDETKDSYTETYRAFRETFKSKALKAFDKFDKFYEEDEDGKPKSFFREDLFAASCALEHISLLDPQKDGKKIEKLVDRALYLAGDNFDILQMCVMIQANILKNLVEAEKTLRRLVNENYNVSINGLLLSRVYYMNKNRPDYDILAKRIGDDSVFEWCENEEEAEKKYIEKRSQKAIERFELFVDAIIEKYSGNVLSRYPEQKLYFSDKYTQAVSYPFYDQFSIIQKSLNQIFSDLSKITFYINPDNYGLTEMKTLLTIANDIHEDIEKLRKEIDTVQKGLEQLGALRHDKNMWQWVTLQSGDINYHKTEKAIEMLEKLANDHINPLYMKIKDKLIESFKEAFSVEAAADSIDSIINEINSWYDKNNLPIPVDNKPAEIITGEPSVVYF